MKISFQNQDITGSLDKQDKSLRNIVQPEKADQNPEAVRLDIGKVTGKNVNLFPGENDKNKGKKTLTEMMQEAGTVDNAVNQDYRTILSNTMSAEDYAKAQEEGFDYFTMDPEDVVTIQDKIKAEVAKGGERIIGYNDDLSGKKLAEALGSETLARSLEDAFSDLDLPLTEGNIADTVKAWDLAKGLTKPDDSEKAYIVENEMKPDLWGLFLSENSGNTEGRDLAEVKVDLSAKPNEKLLKQVKDILADSGYETQEEMDEGIKAAQWLLDRGLPVNSDNIFKLRTMEEIELPITEDFFAEKAAEAISRGEKPSNLTFDNNEGADNILTSAVMLEEFVFSEHAADVIKDRRTLEEIRLSMTAEVNIKLLESGFSIDTSPIEEFIEALKNAEIEVAEKYFSPNKSNLEKKIQADYSDDSSPKEGESVKNTEAGRVEEHTKLSDGQRNEGIGRTQEKVTEPEILKSPDAGTIQNAGLDLSNNVPKITEDRDKSPVANEQVLRYRLMRQTNLCIADIKDTPVAKIGEYVSSEIDKVQLGDYHSTASELRDKFQKAGQSYEALMTAPRADLGDSIKKAFANASSLAKQVGISDSEENLRAIRILGYNRMEISRENVERIVAADSCVRGVVEKMTPASVLAMIRDGINPLETSFAELSTYLDAQQTGGYESTAKSYSAFLFGLEMQDNITPEERESYIGIYRLIHQIEKADGAAIGTVINEQAVLSFENLLSAARTRRLRGVDVKVDATFGASSDIIKVGNSITEQIESAFRPERYAREAEELRQAALISRSGVQSLENFGIAGTAENLIAIENLLEKESNLFAEMSKYRSARKRVKELSEKIVEDLSEEDFDESYEEVTKEFTRISEDLTMSAERYIDVRAMALVNRQLTIAAKISAPGDPLADKDYVIPMELAGEMSKVRISFRSAAGNASLGISTVIGEDSIDARFELSKNSFGGYLIQNSFKTVKNLQGAVDIFTETLRKEKYLEAVTVGNIPVVSKDVNSKKGVSFEKEYSHSKDAQAVNSDGSERKILLQVTKVFLQTLKQA